MSEVHAVSNRTVAMCCLGVTADQHNNNINNSELTTFEDDDDDDDDRGRFFSDGR